jgi:hypothetical protein
MPRQKDLKRVVRARMKKTGESYTAARVHVVARKNRTNTTAASRPAIDVASVVPVRDEAIAARTGHTWAEWVRLLDAENAASLPHRDIAMIVNRKHGVPGWWSQAVTVGYERIKGLRAPGQRRGGTFEASKSRTFNVPVDALFAAWADAAVRRRWLNGINAKVRSSTAPKTIRLDLPDGTLVVGWFERRSTVKSVVSLAHQKLRDRAAAEESKRFWGERLNALREVLAGEGV